MPPRLGTAAALAILAAAASAQKPGDEVTVPGTANPWLAGMPEGTRARTSDSAPAHAPVLVTLPADPGKGASLSFAVEGSVSFAGGTPRAPPDGGALTRHLQGAEHGIAGLHAPANALIGVFLDDDRPDRTPAPETLDFGRMGRDFRTLSPALRQPFFIGDGLTGNGSGDSQRFLIPQGATRLFLGTMDAWGWYNNSGAFRVRVTLHDGG